MKSSVQNPIMDYMVRIQTVNPMPENVLGLMWWHKQLPLSC